MISHPTGSITMICEEDPTFDRFEAKYPIPDGMTYNCYVIKDEKTALLDTDDARVTENWLADLKDVLGDGRLDYLVVHHVEPDHTANIMSVLDMYPEARLVTSARGLKFLAQFFGVDLSARCDVVKEGDVLDLGEHRLRFVETPMVHWPEVIMSYEEKTGTLFSADGFGRFGPADPSYDWLSGGRRYYMNIVVKFGPMVRKALEKLSGLEIRRICPLHGNVLDKDVQKYIGYYDLWSSYRPETDGVAVLYASFYGNTRRAAEHMCQILKGKGAQVQLVDLTRTDVSYAMEAAFRYSRMVIAAPTYEGGLSPHMKHFLEDLAGKGYRNRKVGIIENGTFGPCAGKFMANILEGLDGVEIVGPKVTILSAMNGENRETMEELAENLLR